MLKKVALLGYPAIYARSPLIHYFFMKEHSIEGRYEIIPTKKEELKEKIRFLQEDNYVGANITIPHKSESFLLCDEVSPAVETLQAVNCLIFREGRILGENTDGEGFIESLHNAKQTCHNKTILLLGGGGAARSILFSLLKENPKHIFICVRNLEKAKSDLAFFRTYDKRFNLVDWKMSHTLLPQIDILINATPLGQTGKPPLDIDLANLKPKSLVCDIVYQPLKTNLLRDALSKGFSILTGDKMLVAQARLSFLHFFGVMPAAPYELFQLLEKDLETKNI